MNLVSFNRWGPLGVMITLCIRYQWGPLSSLLRLSLLRSYLTYCPVSEGWGWGVRFSGAEGKVAIVVVIETDGDKLESDLSHSVRPKSDDNHTSQVDTSVRSDTCLSSRQTLVMWSSGLSRLITNNYINNPVIGLMRKNTPCLPFLF